MKQPTYNDPYAATRPERPAAGARPQRMIDVLTEWAAEPTPFEGSFTAKQAAPCASCPTRIQPQDLVQTGLDGQVEHTDCPVPDAPYVTCAVCWQTLALNGSCGCA